MVGQVERAVMRAQNLLHRGIAILVKDSHGRVYVHRRTATKDLFPSMYDMFIGGVVAAGESYEEAARREAEEELGVTSPLDFMFDHLYQGPQNRAWVRAFSTVWDGPIHHQEDEVEWGDWMPESDLPRWIELVQIVPDGLDVFHRYWEWKQSH